MATSMRIRPFGRFTRSRWLAGLLVAGLVACGGKKDDPPDPVAPSITTQPQGVTVTVGETATFTVVATGTAPLSYQWSKDDTAIVGATSASYTTGSTALADSGAVYRVTVSNAAGDVTSDPATLTVTSPAVQFVVYADGAVGEGWAPQVWNACGTDNPNMNASFAGQTTASFDLSCWAAGWTAGTFGHWSAKFDLSAYDTLSFDIGSEGGAGMAQLAVWFDNNQSVEVGPVVAGQLNHVTVLLEDVGLTDGELNQFGWFFQAGTAGPKFYVNNVAFSAQRPTTPPTISALAVSQVADYSATITFTTDRAATPTVTAQAEGGPAIPAGGPAGTEHAVLVESLQPSTLYHVTVVATDAWGNASAPATIDLTTSAADPTPDVTVTLDPAHPAPISPWIYGINGLESADVPLLTLERSGGNRLTAYNWENNASNAGSDWRYSSDSFLGGGNTPAEVARLAIASARARDAASLVTFQMQGWVSADKDGEVNMDDPLETRLATRFKEVVPKKSTVSAEPFTVTPSTTDAWVFMDEFAWALDQKFPGADIFGADTALPTFVSLDNEPELWNHTHEEIQGSTRVTADEVIQQTVALSRALKDQFPDVKIFGPAHYGFMGMWNWQDDPTLGGGVNWFTDKYLHDLAAASDDYGARLVDVYDFHWYAEVYDGDGTRITGMRGPDLSDEQVQLIVQSPRSLWDPTFSDSHDWISRDVLNGPIRILPRIQEKIVASFPGTKIAITEYESGGWSHIAGTIAQADNLGIFGAQGVFAANFWPPGVSHEHALAGFRAFRGFDGGSACFGDTSIPATSSDVSLVSVHASKDSAAPGRTVLVAINRSTGVRKVSIGGDTLSGTATIYRMTAGSAQAQVNAGQRIAPVLVGTQPVSGTSMLVVLPPLSVSTIEIQ